MDPIIFEGEKLDVSTSSGDFIPAEVGDGYESGSSLDSSYDDELHMAALIGKRLLDRNCDLEHQLTLSVQENQEQAKEIELLSKQIAELRESENLRALTYEQWDLTRIQVESDNEKLLNEKQLQYKLIANLQYNIEQLEEKCSSLEAELSQVVEQQASTRRNQISNRTSFYGCDSSAMRRTYSMEDFAIHPLRSDFNSRNKSTYKDHYGSSLFAQGTSEVCYYNNPVAEKLGKVTFERDKLARQNKMLTDMIDKCEDEIQKHVSAYEEMEANIQSLHPKAQIMQKVEDLLTWYVQSNNGNVNADNLCTLKEKLKMSFEGLGKSASSESGKCNKVTGSNLATSLDGFLETVIGALTNTECCLKCQIKRKQENQRNVSCQTFPVFKRRPHNSRNANNRSQVTGLGSENRVAVEFTYDTSTGTSSVSKDCKTLLDSIYKCLAEAKST